ncbi:MAG: DNA repair protein RecN, partial [bacterium]
DEQIEYYTAQYNELKDLSYSDDDIDELENELQVLKDYEKLNTYIESLSAVLDHSTGAIEQIHEAVRIMSHLSDYPDFADDYDQLYNLYYSLIDIDDHIHMTFSRYDFNEYRFNELQDELYRIARLKRKYGYSMDAIYEARDQLAERIEQASHRDELLSSLRQQETKSYEALNQCGEALHAQRLKIAHLFEKKLSQELIDLYLPNAAFKVDIKRIKPAATGIDQVTFLVAMNKGAHLSTLNETASGGEISRLMLAIKTITLNNSAIDTIIFDEVDTGVSGKVADAIGEKMHHLALNKQVICVTHLPQVAVHGDHHFAIKKKDVDDMTYSNMVQLDIEGQIQEIAQMLSGNEITQEAILNAKKLLKLS